MEMVAAESIGVGKDLTPPLSPIAYSLDDSFLPSNCANCFSPLPLPLSNPNHHLLCYCSPSCSSSHSPLHISSAAHLLSPDPLSLETSILRVALLLLLQIKHPYNKSSYHRIYGLMSNCHNLLTSIHDDDDDYPTRIKTGARAMAMAATSMRDGSQEGFLLEEAVLCVVLTNAVEVQDKSGRSVGVAVYDITFSWINHSCSPNACYEFLPPEMQSGEHRCLISPASSEPVDLLKGSGAGPRIVVRSIKTIKKGEQVTISYTDLLQPKELRQSELWSKYRFTCCCHRCVAIPLDYVDQRLQQEIGGSYEYITEYIDNAIHDYLSSSSDSSDAESCCKKLEYALLNHESRLHPQNHLSLKAYTTLASAYSTASANAIEGEKGVKMKRFNAAYSFLIAQVINDLFLHESGLIDSALNFWIGAGVDLISFARCLVSSSSRKCYTKGGCGSIDIFEANCEVLDMCKQQLLSCIREITGKVWKFLVVGNGYLEVVKDPMDLRWFEDKIVADEDGGSDCVDGGQQVFSLGAHCLLYVGILSNISWGRDSHFSCYVQELLSELRRDKLI